jgi:hypothetical protein
VSGYQEYKAHMRASSIVELDEHDIKDAYIAMLERYLALSEKRADENYKTFLEKE